MGLILDTNFIIFAERESRKSIPLRTQHFLGQHSDETFFSTFTIAGELACGASAENIQERERICQPFQILPSSPQISWHYGVLYRHLASLGQMIGTNDLWIAATALYYDFGLVTLTTKEFERVPRLRIHTY